MRLHRAIAFIGSELRRRGRSPARWLRKVGYSHNLLWLWERGQNARLQNVEDVLNSLGYTLYPIPIEEAEERDRIKSNISA